MTRRCSSPLSWDTLAAYWAGDLPDAEPIEEHLMGCGECSRMSERVAAITEAVRQMIPPFVGREQLESLHARGLRIEENVIRPDVETPVYFAATIDLLVHRLSGLDLADAERVDVAVRDQESGQVMMRGTQVPFDAVRGEVLIACQRHFAAFPPRVAFDVTAIRPGRSAEKKTYLVPHVFER